MIRSSAPTLFECELYVNAMRLRTTQHGVSCNECNNQGFKPPMIALVAWNTVLHI